MNPLWNTIAQRGGVSLSEEQDKRLGQYLDHLLSVNAVMNLTGIRDRSAAEVLHVADSLTALGLLPPGPIRLTDVGSGGGAPGIPLAIARPDAQVLLIESTRKKAGFLRQTIAALELKNVSVTEQRAEEVGRSPLRETFDVSIARAVATAVWLAEWCLPLVRVGGKTLCMKGPKAAEEMPAARRAIEVLGGAAPIIHPIDLPGAERHVIIEILKLRHAPARYPRLPTDAKGRAL